MKNFNLIFSIIAIFFNMSICSVFDEYQYPELAKFLQKYQCSQQVEADALAEYMTEQGYRDIPDEEKKYFMKKTAYVKDKYRESPQFSRIINALRLENYIRENHLDRLSVAEKCLTRDLRFIVAKAVHHVASEKEITLSEMQQLAQFTKETGFSDFAGNGGKHRNMYKDQHGRLIFIDTEDRSFNCPKTWWPSYLKTHFLKHQLTHLLDYVNRPRDNGINIGTKAQKWLGAELELESIRAKDNVYVSSSIPMKAMPDNSKYDDRGINFEQVKSEFNAWLYERK